MTQFDYMRELLARVDRLDKRISDTQERMNEMTKMIGDTIALMIERRRMQESHITDIYDRLAHVENFLFPNAIGELNEVQKIIGEADGNDLNRLDRRNI